MVNWKTNRPPKWYEKPGPIFVMKATAIAVVVHLAFYLVGF